MCDKICEHFITTWSPMCAKGIIYWHVIDMTRSSKDGMLPCLIYQIRNQCPVFAKLTIDDHQEGDL